jgi:hypothetical protein
MDLHLLECTVREARAKVADYRRVIKKQHSAADAALLRAYREILRGERVLDLYEVFANNGFDHSEVMPRLAIARADDAWCHLRRWTSRTVMVSRPEKSFTAWYAYRRQARSRVFTIPSQTLATTSDEDGLLPTGRAAVPTIPPDVRADLPGKLSGYAILWEADWEDVPYDPILLKPLGQNLYKVIAQWDLTELERAVLFDVRFGG